MEQDFWHQRWHNNEIGFHQETVNPYLLQYWPRMQLQPGARVLIPCCGKSLDLLWLHEQGFDVMGVEISTLAVAAFFTDHQLQAKNTEQGGYRISSMNRLQLYCGDFFQLTATDVNGVAAVYDRGSMVAMPAEMRRDYCNHLQEITNKQVPILLVTLDYPETEMQGPPFSISENEIHSTYANDYEIVILETQDILTDEPFFQDKGLTRLQERAYILSPRKA